MNAEIEKRKIERTYICDECGLVFASDRDPEETMAECREHFGPCDESDTLVACTPCWNRELERKYGRSEAAGTESGA